MIIELRNAHNYTEEQLGGKALNLAKLFHFGLPVPAAIVVPHYIDFNDTKNIETLHAQTIFNNNQSGLYAVRSSGIGEDSEQNSFAGVFDTFLDIPKKDLVRHIEMVRESAFSTRSKVYSQNRYSEVKGMNVIVQRMVQASFAGVVFTRSPVENDDRIGLLELVVGSGDKLVSGKITPTSIRYNKLTHQYTVMQQGTDEILIEDIDHMLHDLLQYISRVEAKYGHAVDVEWACATDGSISILQARPITT